MSIHFLDLPSEILTMIFYPLDLRSLIACIATNRRVKSIIDGSALLQYRLAAQAACVDDIPGNTSLTSTDRLAALQKRQAAFAEGLPSSMHTIQMDDFPIYKRYGLSGGIFVVTEPGEKALRWTSLESSAQQEPVWERLEFNEYIVEFALAVPEEDLLVVLSSTATPNADVPSSDVVLKLRFYEMTTHSAHRAAVEPVIVFPIAVTPWPEFELDICGPKVSILMFSVGDLGPSNRLLVYDWKKGRLQMERTTNFDQSTTVFLSPEVLLFVHTPGVLELWTISELPERSEEPEISLTLPNLPDHCECEIKKVELNPKGHYNAASQPFGSSFAASLVVLGLLYYPEEGSAFQEMFLIIPRQALLQQISCAKRAKVLSWEEWGPPISRWIHANFGSYGAEWPTIACGQKFAFITPWSALVLLDFNSYTQRRTLPEQMELETGSVEFERILGQFVLMPSSELDIVDELTLFGGQPHSRLAYVGKVTQKPPTWSGVIMNEGWIVGINDTTESDGKFWLDVWHFG
ncbi:hypothetical protein MSAN_01257000 [Mycena sanguinolenta]|uniref:F-box domain-containing protein n=1 Tax=Mycena sanguinolenta TaxID=230812 RepID=A0A8H7D215_9AGAR|nr:hypothetical protein MSAN_01257000 [Mycena sanguinolenta]